jgi:hypothetical protein
MSEPNPFQIDEEQMALLTAGFANFFAQIASVLDAGLTLQEGPKCTVCQSLTFSSLISGFQIHSDYGAFCASCISCPLCRVFQCALLNQPSENWWPDEDILLSDIVTAKLVRDEKELNRFPERLEITVLRSEEDIKKQLEHDKYDKHPEIKLVKHCIVCIEESRLKTKNMVEIQHGTDENRISTRFRAKDPAH